MQNQEEETIHEGCVMPESVALSELKTFVKAHRKGIPATDEKLKEEFVSAIYAIMSGALDVSDPLSPVLKLTEPILDSEGNVDVSEIKFKTRIKPLTQEQLTKNIDIGKEAIKYMNVATAHLCGLVSTAYLDKFGKFDFSVIRDLTGLFM